MLFRFLPPFASVGIAQNVEISAMTELEFVSELGFGVQGHVDKVSAGLLNLWRWWRRRGDVGAVLGVVLGVGGCGNRSVCK